MSGVCPSGTRINGSVTRVHVSRLPHVARPCTDGFLYFGGEATEGRESCIKYFPTPVVAPDTNTYNPCPGGSNLLTIKTTETRASTNLLGFLQTLAAKNGGATNAYVGALYAFADTGFAWRWVDDTPVGNLADGAALWGGGPAYSSG